MRRCLILLLTLLWSEAGVGAEVVDATGRTVQLPDHIVHIVPAGPPAAILLAAVAPDLMAGWPFPVADDARALLSPDAARLPQIPRLTSRANVLEEIEAMQPDLILDYGTVSPRYADLAQATQQRTGIPTVLLDGSLTKIPAVFRMLGHLLHREDRGEVLAGYAEALLALPSPATRKTVLYARGTNGLTVAAPDTDVTEVFNRLGWRVVAPDGQGTFRIASIEAIRALDPDMLIFADPAMRETVAKSAEWKTMRAVREGHALIAPSLPFGWVEEPPSINRLVGLAWLTGRDPVTLAALTNAIVYAHVLTPDQLANVVVQP
jgi:iron complex transport system substrate-binding protein